MLNLFIIAIVAALVIAFWSRWGSKVMGLLEALTSSSSPAPQRVAIRKRDRFREWELEAQFRDLDAAEELKALKAELSVDEVAEGYLKQFENDQAA